MSRTTSMRWLTLTTVLLVLGCSDAATPTGPTNSLAPAFSMASNSAKADHEALKQELEAQRAYFKAMREANKESFRAARAEWKAWKEDWKQQYKLQREAWKREHPGARGGPEIQLLRCEPQDYSADAAIIGPNGGTLHVGRHELVVPQGALDHEVLITAEAPTSSLLDVKFAPEGLTFLKSAQLTLSYKGCVRPTEADFLVAYLGQGNQILELPPSIDDKADDEVEADIGHFSRYAVAW
jgi:hypothetical protein